MARLHAPLTFTAHVTLTVAGTHLTKVTFGWGDGQSTSGTSLTALHSYAKRGRFVISLVAQDSLGQLSMTTASITAGTALSVKPSGPHRIAAGRKGVFRTKVVDPNTGGKIRRLTWTWGDGHHSAGTTARHAWAKRGRYRVTLTAADNTGVTTARTLTVIVT